jgi:putative membrane protein insertion efficiency factor
MKSLSELPRRLVQFLLLGLIQAYRYLISPWLGRRCRFHPSCSEYALQALHKHGPWCGSWLTVCRVGRCHPFSAGGYDPVP